MKTIEEKARAYDEAIKKAAALYKASEPMSGCNVILETLFPELAESEDEKVRKALIDFFGKSAKYGGQTNGVYDKDILAWLERQVEQNFEMKTAEESLGVDSKTYNKIVDECIFVEQKPEENKGNIGGISANPAWSEEDGMILSLIVNSLRFIRDTLSHDNKYTVDVGSFESQIEWLQSLQDRVQPQPKQEWSEEDEKIFRTILSDGIRGAELDMLQVNWLKSLKGRLKPQNRWKPSELQL